MSKTKAVAYIRVSTEKDAQLHSYEFQEQYWQNAFAGDQETELVGIYADKGISGHSIQKRPQFLVMMQDAREHKFEKVYVKSVSRFARNTTQLLEAVRELRDIGIEVIFENENIHTFEPTSEVYLTIAATIAENDLEVDSERMRWSFKHRFENGWVCIGPGTYGLRMAPDNEIEVVPDEAAVIRYMFEKYLDGLGSKRIADALNEAGVKTRDGRAWTAPHVTRIIKNEKYKGDCIMGKTVERFGERHKNHDGKYGPRYYMEDTHEAIVDKETWNTAQRIMAERGKNHNREPISHTFTSMIQCGCCGKNFVHKVNNCTFKWKTDIWACGAQLIHGVSACRNSRIKDAVLKAKFIEAYNEFIEKRPEGDSVVAMQEVLADLRQQERELAELHMSRLIPDAAYNTERDGLKAQIADITEKITERRIKRVPESEHVPITQFDADKAIKFLTKVIVTEFTVTFVFYNGAKISRKYDNGKPGNKPGWNKKKEEA